MGSTGKQHSKHIIGLSYENFKRTIIIPQGQFKEFIELGAKERTDMMKEIFQCIDLTCRIKFQPL
jgi:DNA repair exonuclease SbcCD ATPase subunit